jgi:hypothetical protein
LGYEAGDTNLHAFAWNSPKRWNNPIRWNVSSLELLAQIAKPEGLEANNRAALPLELLELNPVGFDGGVAQTAFFVFFVVGKVAFEPLDVAVAFECQNVRC